MLSLVLGLATNKFISQTVKLSTMICEVVGGRKVYIVKMNKKGMIIIPKEYRQKLNTDTLLVEYDENNNRIIITPFDLSK